MLNPTHTEKLDGTLLVLKDYEIEIAPISGLLDKINEHHKWNIKSEELYRILGKLRLDGYAESAHPQFVRITFNGYLFQENGGYKVKALRDANDALLTQMEIDRQRTLDSLLATNSTRLNALTNRLFWATVIASIGALLLLFWQFWIWNYPTEKSFSTRNHIENVIKP